MQQTVYFSTRRCITGSNEYRYFRGIEPLGEASALTMRSYPVSIRGARVTLHYTQDMNRTIFPGVHKIVHCAHTGDAFASVIWMRTGTHMLYINSEKVDIQCQNGVYRFSRDGREIAVMAPSRKKDAPGFPGDEHWEPQYVMMTAEPIPDQLALLMLAFPLLQIAP